MMLFTLRTHALPSIRPLRCRDRAVCSFELFSRYTTAMRAIRRKTRGYDNEISADGHEHARDARTHSDLVRDARSTLYTRYTDRNTRSPPPHGSTIDTVRLPLFLFSSHGASTLVLHFIHWTYDCGRRAAHPRHHGIGEERSTVRVLGVLEAAATAAAGDQLRWCCCCVPCRATRTRIARDSYDGAFGPGLDAQRYSPICDRFSVRDVPR